MPPSVAGRENPGGAFEPLEHHIDDRRSFGPSAGRSASEKLCLLTAPARINPFFIFSLARVTTIRTTQHSVLVQPDGWARGEREGYGGRNYCGSLSLHGTVGTYGTVGTARLRYRRYQQVPHAFGTVARCEVAQAGSKATYSASG